MKLKRSRASVPRQRESRWLATLLSTIHLHNIAVDTCAELLVPAYLIVIGDGINLWAKGRRTDRVRDGVHANSWDSPQTPIHYYGRLKTKACAPIPPASSFACAFEELLPHGHHSFVSNDRSICVFSSADVSSFGRRMCHATWETFSSLTQPARPPFMHR